MNGTNLANLVKILMCYLFVKTHSEHLLINNYNC